MTGFFIEKMTKNIIIGVLILIILDLTFDVIGLNKTIKNNDNQISNLLNEKSKTEKSIDEKNREITKVTSIVIEKDKLIEKQIKEIKKLKSLDAKIVYQTKTQFDTIEIGLQDTILITKNDTIRADKFSYRDSWLVMDGIIKKDSLFFDSLVVINKYNIEIGESKKGLFKKEKSVFIRNDNPYSTTTNAQSIVLKEGKKWYEKGIFKMGMAAVFSFYLARQI